MKANKGIFYLLSFTWGLPMTLIGCMVAGVLRLAGQRPTRWGWCYYFEIGSGWGGVELGVVFLAQRKPSRHIRNHEHGHALQNCLWGPLMPFVICLPSAVRYWYREYRQRVKGDKGLPHYDAIWFEGQATRWGTALIDGEGKGK